MSERILVTGCCGFIGSNMCEYLIEKNHNVIGIDNLLTGNLNNISNINSNKKFIFIKHDVCNEINLDVKVHKIMHFASTASPKDYLKFPIKTLQIGSQGTENVLNLALKNNATVLVASTSEVYGDPLVHPQSEDYFGNVNPIGPRGVYDEAKRYLEAITMAYNKKLGLDTKIVRIFNTFGPKMRKDDGRAIPNFINQILENKNITVYGNGKQTRSFCYINDTIEGCYKAIKSDYNFPINIGNPKEYTILELIKILEKLTLKKCDLEFFDLPQDDPKVRRPEIALAKKLLNWQPKTKLEDGLIKTINYFCNN